MTGNDIADFLVPYNSDRFAEARAACLHCRLDAVEARVERLTDAAPNPQGILGPDGRVLPKSAWPTPDGGVWEYEWTVGQDDDFGRPMTMWSRLPCPHITKKDLSAAVDSMEAAGAAAWKLRQ